MAVFYGMNPPFLGGPQNVLSRQEDEKLIKNDILQLLHTLPGERVMRPRFGTPLRGLLFEKLTDSDLSLLELEIKRSIDTEEPRVTNLQVKTSLDRANHTLNLVILCVLKRDPTKALRVDTFIKQGQFNG